MSRRRDRTASVAHAALLAVAAVAAARSARTWVSSSWLRRADRRAETAEPVPFVIVLPAYREQDIVARTVDHFLALDYPPDLYRVVVVTSERETPGPDGDPTTAQVLERTLAALPEARRERVHAVRAPADHLHKAGQLRFAMSTLRETLSGWSERDRLRYVGMYDFDARPTARTLRAAAVAARSGAPVLQQPGFTVPRAGRATRTTGRFFSVLEAQFHSRFGLRVELANLLQDEALSRLPRTPHRILRSGVHTVGVGLFVDHVRLDELGGIPPVVDDLAVGWRAVGSGFRIAPIACPTSYDAYGSRAEAHGSRRFVFDGYLRCARDMHGESRDTSPMPNLLLTKVYLRGAQWALGPHLRLAVLALCLPVAPVPALGAAGLSYLLLLSDMLVVRAMWSRFGLVDVPFAGTSRVGTLLAAPAVLVWYGAAPREHLAALLAARLRTLGGAAPDGADRAAAGVAGDGFPEPAC